MIVLVVTVIVYAFMCFAAWTHVRMNPEKFQGRNDE